MVLEPDPFGEHGPTLQDFGAVFGFELASERLVFASQNAPDFLSETLDGEMFSSKMAQILGSKVSHSVRNVQTLPTLAKRPRSLGLFQLGRQRCIVMVFKAADFLVLEAIPVSRDDEPSAIGVLNDVQLVADAILDASDPEEMFERLTSFVRTMSGYHSVQAHRISDNDAPTCLSTSGRSIVSDAETRHFQHFSFLVDASLQGQELLKIDDGLRLPSLELATARTIQGDASQEPRTNGIAACASLSFRKRGRNWGVLQLLHQAPRVPNRRTQLVLEHLSPIIEQRLEAIS